MYAVIFRAQIKHLDREYSETAKRMRDLAISEYGCLEFSACTEEMNEIAISYWPSLQHIKAWQNNPEHKAAQALGKSKWYNTYQIDVVEVVRAYEKNG
ncbi:MAG: antibiotic biosynthesis monooxygenase [Candidatus Thiodiazotropha sp. DIVDIV]